MRALSGGGVLSPADVVVHAWRKFPFLDPDLPAQLLAPGWPRERAHDLFVSRHERWRVKATEYFAALEGELDVGEERAA